MPKATPSPIPTARAAFRTANEVVAYNLARARRTRGWTQAEAADRLQKKSGKTWNAATLGAAERTAKLGRTRQFDANELLTFSLVFDQPIAYFFLPPDIDEEEVVVFLHNRVEDSSAAPSGVDEQELLRGAIPLKFSAELIDGVNRVLAKRDQTWSPGTARIEGFRPEETVGWSDATTSEEPHQHTGQAKQTSRIERLTDDAIGAADTDSHSTIRHFATDAVHKIFAEEFDALTNAITEKVVRRLQREIR
ncbi:MULTISPECIES: hypothetical protein [unclassified Streptomyces]|uniref:hypothetical protein n=1 Tax=unclassified Streptomyces TaxID=2593676 RepID=UPI0038073E59